MRTIQLTGKTGPDGVLDLRVPVGTAEAEFDVVVIVQLKARGAADSPEARGWPPGFFEKTAGAWQGEFERPPQGEFEKRLEFE